LDTTSARFRVICVEYDPIQTNYELASENVVTLELFMFKIEKITNQKVTVSTRKAAWDLPLSVVQGHLSSINPNDLIIGSEFIQMKDPNTGMMTLGFIPEWIASETDLWINIGPYSKFFGLFRNIPKNSKRILDILINLDRAETYSVACPTPINTLEEELNLRLGALCRLANAVAHINDRIPTIWKYIEYEEIPEITIEQIVEMAEKLMTPDIDGPSEAYIARAWMCLKYLEFLGKMNWIPDKFIIPSIQEKRRARIKVSITVDFNNLIAQLKDRGIILQSIECPKCGGKISLPKTGNITTCTYCGSQISAIDVYERFKSILM